MSKVRRKGDAREAWSERQEGNWGSTLHGSPQKSGREFRKGGYCLSKWHCGLLLRAGSLESRRPQKSVDTSSQHLQCPGPWVLRICLLPTSLRGKSLCPLNPNQPPNVLIPSKTPSFTLVYPLSQPSPLETQKLKPRFNSWLHHLTAVEHGASNLILLSLCSSVKWA